MSGLTPIPGMGPVETVALAAAVASAVLGLYIGFQAFRGLRRNDSRAMRYLSAGLILLFGVTYAVAIGGQFLFTIDVIAIRHQDWFRLAVRGLQVTGLAFIAYSMHVGPDDPEASAADQSS